MSKKYFAIDDITDDLIRYIDRYQRRVIINTKRKFYRKSSNPQSRGIVFIELEECTDSLWSIDPGIERLLCDYIEVKGVKIPVFNTKLSEALNELTETQRTILLQNVILKIPLNQIADELGISTRMTEKHKHNAIMFLKRRLIHHE